MTRYRKRLHFTFELLLYLIDVHQIIYLILDFACSVQKAAIPSLIEGRDVFVKSKTGTGKDVCMYMFAYTLNTAVQMEEYMYLYLL